MDKRAFNADENSDIEIINSVLEILLGHADNELAEKLVKRFGTVTRIFNASEAELAEVSGLSERVVSFFLEARPTYRQALIREAKGLRVTNESALFKYVLAAFGGERKKSAIALYTDKRGKTVGMEDLPEGSPVRAAVGELCREGAARLAILVGSPSGSNEPTTKTLKDLAAIVGALEDLGAEFIDYVVYAPDRFFSLRRMTENRENNITFEQADTAPYTALGGFTESVEAAAEERARRMTTAFLDLSRSRLV